MAPGMIVATAADANNVYWFADDGFVRRAALVGGSPIVLAQGLALCSVRPGTPLYGPSRIAVDSTSVYWTNWCDGSVIKLTPKA